MSDPLLKTKLTPPIPRKDLVKRPRLVDELNAGLLREQGFERKLTLVSAPAGFGKTTLVTYWLSQAGLPVLWLTLDEGDNDPARFLAYLLAALRQLDEKIGRGVSGMLQSPLPPPAEALITTLINDLAAVSTPFFLVLDDYHFIHNQVIHKQVSFLLEHLPDTLHLVVLTREDPLLPISRLRSRGQLCELRQDNLRFNPQETADFLQRIMRLPLMEGDLETLLNRTEGWAAGLQLAALALRASLSAQGSPDAHQFIQSLAGSSRYILDYLFDEVFSRQDATIQDFLLKTAILEKLNAGLCDFVAERQDSRERLDVLEKANLFIAPLDAERQWYRYHHLFGELLRHQLNVQSKETVTQLHRRACQWFAEHGYSADAMQHALAGQDWEQAGKLLVPLNEELLKRGEYVTLIGWYQKFPEPALRSNPWLCQCYSWPLLLSGHYDAAEAMLAQAETMAGDDTRLIGGIATAQAYLARSRGDMKRTIETSARALQYLQEADHNQRSILSLNLGIAYWHVGKIAEARQALLDAQSSAQVSGNRYALLTSIIFLARVHAVSGELYAAEQTIQQAILHGGEAPILVLAYLDLAAIHYERNNLPGCRAALQQGMAFSQRSGNMEFITAGYFQLARLECALRNMPEAYGALQKIVELTRQEPLPLPAQARVLACQVETALAGGDVAAAQRWASQMTFEADAHPFYRFFSLAQARLLIAQGKRAEAAGLLTEKLAKAEAAGWVYGAIVLRILLACVAEKPEAALPHLTWVLPRTQPEGYIRSYVDAGAALAPMLQEAARRGVQPEYVGRILAALGEKPADEAQPGSLGGGNLIEKLSERELEVLRLVTAGLSNREIASQLFLSPGTVKTHVHNIYGKLGVENRTQAVVKAREFDII